MDLVIATRNEGKLKEITNILHDLPLTLLSLRDFPEAPEVIESGESFEENALMKARAMATYTGKLVLADDSGLEVAALDGRPGVYSARFAHLDLPRGKAGSPKAQAEARRAGAEAGASDTQNNECLLKELTDVPEDQRQARFVCVVALVHPDGSELTVRGSCEGLIGTEPRGQGGFGYDPLFWTPGVGKTFAELAPEEKAVLSHRGQALRKLKPKLAEFLKKFEG